MPNHVKNRLTAPSSVIDRLMGTDSEGKPRVDFGKIIPRPAEVVGDMHSSHVKNAAEIALGLIDFRQPNITAAEALERGGFGAAADVMHVSICTRQLFEGPMPKDFSDEDFDIFIRLLKAHRSCNGLMDWYDWNIAMWGTKWNAYDTRRESDSILLFETAWSAPHPVIERLHEIATLGFRHEWADEDTGRNVGVRQYHGGGGFTETLLDGSRAGFELCFALDHADPSNYELDGETYRYKDDE